ncbi:MAG: hypothetical protein JSR80_04880, partial [Verrucomicrobia bacterium]|nr:hypothetical protein [Verrucomicrobiota bacterium]
MRAISYFGLLLSCLLPFAAHAEEYEERSILSSPEQIATLNSEPDFLIGGVVSPLSGQPVLRQTDMVIRGAQDIVLSRTYISPYMPVSLSSVKGEKGDIDNFYLFYHLQDHYRGWQSFPHLRLELDYVSSTVRFTDRHGSTLDFCVKEGKTTLASPTYAITNTQGDTASGKYDPRNTRIEIASDLTTVVVRLPDGSCLEYEKLVRFGRSSLIYGLAKERLPNGKILKYSCFFAGDKRVCLATLESLDPSQRYTYASLHQENGSHWTSSTGLTTDYKYVSTRCKAKIRKDHAEKKLNYDPPPLLVCSSSPNYRHETLTYQRFQLTSSLSKSDNAKFTYAGVGSEPHYRVDKLLRPVGEGESYIPLDTFAYQPAEAGNREGRTTVTSADGSSTVYLISKELLPLAIQSYDPQGVLRLEKFYTWDEKQWLTSLEVRDGEGQLFYQRAYLYDSFGNPVLEAFSGEDDYTIKRAFSQEGRNLLLREEHEEGKVVTYEYLPNTNLVTAKLTYEGSK